MARHTPTDPTAAGGRNSLTAPHAGALIVWLFLWGTFLLRIPVFLLLAFALAAALFGAALITRGRLDFLGGLVLANYGFWLVSGLLIGGVALADLVSPEFYANDGRGFLFYLPLLFFSVFFARRAELALGLRTVVALAVGSLVLLGVWFAVRPAMLSVGEADNFGGLLTSHTGAGTFFGVLAVFLLIFGIERQKRSLQVLGLMMVIPLFASASRQALVSLLVALGWYVFRRANRRTRLGLAGAIGLALLSFPIVSPHTFDRTVAIFSPETASLVGESLQHLTWEPAPGQELGGVESNILSRFILWAYAVRKFGESPVVGIGFGRYNDFSLRYAGRPGLAYLAVRGDRQTNVFNAHNMYLHQAAETGLVGLALLVALWVAMFRRLAPIPGLPGGHPVLAGFTAAQGLIVFTLVSAAFDNALVAPSIGIPVLTVCGALLSYQRRSEMRVAVAQPPNPRFDEGVVTA